MSTTNFKATNRRILDFLQSGGNITANQARQKFGITNVSARMSEIRKAGFAVYLNTKKTAAGRTIRTYQLGNPTRRVIAAGTLVLQDPYFRALIGNQVTENLDLV